LATRTIRTQGHKLGHPVLGDIIQRSGPPGWGCLKLDSKIWSWVLRDFDPRVPALARPKSNCTCKLRRLILSSEKVTHIKKPAIVKQKTKTWSWVPDGSPTPRRTGRLTVGRNVALTLLRSRFSVVFLGPRPNFELVPKFHATLHASHAALPMVTLKFSPYTKVTLTLGWITLFMGDMCEGVQHREDEVNVKQIN
jgi:hypothetical protein